VKTEKSGGVTGGEGDVVAVEDRKELKSSRKTENGLE